MNSFQEIYAKLSDKELYKVLQNETDYNPEAISVAQKEFQKRGLSLIDFEEFDTIKETNFDLFESRFSISKTIEVFRPIKDQRLAGDIFIKRISFLVIALAIYKLIRAFESIDYITHYFDEWNLEFSFIFFNIVLLFVLAFLIVLKKKIAWYLLGIYSFKSFFYSALTFHSSTNHFIKLFHKIPYYYLCITFIFLAVFGLMGSFLMKKSVRDELGIINNDILILLILSVLYTSWFFIYYNELGIS